MIQIGGIFATSHRDLSQLLLGHYHESLEDHHGLPLLSLPAPRHPDQCLLSEMLEQELQIWVLISTMWEDFRRRMYQSS
jgi:hypothetical protein